MLRCPKTPGEHKIRPNPYVHPGTVRGESCEATWKTFVGANLVFGHILLALLFFTAACGVKIDQLPLLSHPYVSEVKFLKEVKNVNGKAKKTPFDHDRLTSPFYFFLKIKEIENNGTLAVVFYENAETTGKKVAEKTFFFGEPGKYYEYIIFFDQVEGLSPGKYRCVVFLNQHLIYECQLSINESPSYKRNRK